MKQKSKGFKGNPIRLKGKKIYQHQKTKKIKKILQNAWLFRGHPFVLHPARCTGQHQSWALSELVI